MAPPIRLGTASPATQPTTALTLALVARLARRAAHHAVDILLLPEAFLGGYPRGGTFGNAVGGRSREGRDDFADYFDGAVDLGDTVGEGGGGAGTRWVNKALASAGADEVRGDGTREELERIAAETGVFIVTGVVEKAGGSLYCAVVYVCPREGMLGKRRKVMPTGSERLIWAQGSPSTLRAVSTTIRGVRVNLAAAICWENYMPPLRQSLYAQNVNLYLAPTADQRDTWLSLMRTVGCEGRCFVVSSNMAVRERGAPQQQVAGTTTRRRRKSVIDEDGNEIVLGCDEDVAVDDDSTAAPSEPAKGRSVNGHAGDAASAWACRGGSCIVSPFGEVLAGPQWEDDEGLIFSDVDFRDCIRGRLDLDTAGSYSRNDAFKLTVEGLDLDPLPY